MSSAFPGDDRVPDLGGRAGLRVDVDHLEDNRVCVAVGGELDLATAEALEQALADALDSEAGVILDLSGVTFMDSTGLASIIAGLNQAGRRGVVLEVATPLPPQPHKLLELTGVIARLSFTPAPPRTRT